jgi:ABC-type sugar transport system substrate-binding protein
MSGVEIVPLLSIPRALSEYYEEEMMKGMKRLFVIAVAVMVIMGLPVAAAVAAGSPSKTPVTFTGTVNDDFQVVAADGTVYEVDANDLGNELVEEVGKKVEVTGVVEIVDDLKSITVLSYKILE